MDLAERDDGDNNNNDNEAEEEGTQVKGKAKGHHHHHQQQQQQEEEAEAERWAGGGDRVKAAPTRAKAKKLLWESPAGRLSYTEGRPSFGDLLGRVRAEAASTAGAQHRSTVRPFVLVCGPEPMSRDVLAACRAENAAQRRSFTSSCCSSSASSSSSYDARRVEFIFNDYNFSL